MKTDIKDFNIFIKKIHFWLILIGIYFLILFFSLVYAVCINSLCSLEKSKLSIFFLILATNSLLDYWSNPFAKSIFSPIFETDLLFFFIEFLLLFDFVLIYDVLNVLGLVNYSCFGIF